MRTGDNCWVKAYVFSPPSGRRKPSKPTLYMVHYARSITSETFIVYKSREAIRNEIE